MPVNHEIWDGVVDRITRQFIAREMQASTSTSMDLAREVRQLNLKVIDTLIDECDRVQRQVEYVFKMNGFRPFDISVRRDSRHSQITISGKFVDDATLWRSKDEIKTLFTDMFNINPDQLTSTASNWAFTIESLPSNF